MADVPKIWEGITGTAYELIKADPGRGCKDCALYMVGSVSVDCGPAPCDANHVLKFSAAKNDDLLDAERYRKLRDSGKFVPGMGNAGWALACGVTGKVDGAARKALDDAVDAMGGGND